jgi:hypothetical protein
MHNFSSGHFALPLALRSLSFRKVLLYITADSALPAADFALDPAAVVIAAVI